MPTMLGDDRLTTDDAGFYNKLRLALSISLDNTLANCRFVPPLVQGREG